MPRYGAQTFYFGDIKTTHSAPLARNPKPGIHWFVDPQNGSDTAGANTGRSWAAAKATMDAVFDEATFGDGDTIYLTGVLREHASTPTHYTSTTRYVHDVSIVGVGNRPRQALTGSTHNGAGATWMSPATPTNTSPLLIVNGQGWHFENIYFNNAATSAACINLLRTDDTVEEDASHARFVNCIFTGETAGIDAEGGPNFVEIDNCEFFNFSDSGDAAIKYTVGEGVGSHLMWKIVNNVFVNNDRHIVVPLGHSFIKGNRFGYVGADVTTTIQISVDGGSNRNVIMDNYFEVAHDQSGTATMFLPQTTTNSWLNYYRGGQTALVPATA